MNTKHNLFPAVLAILIVSGASAAEDPDAGYGYTGYDKKDLGEIAGSIPGLQARPDFKVTAKLPKVPESLPTYQVVHLDPTAIDPYADPVALAFDFSPKDKVADKHDDGSTSMMLNDAEQRSIEYFSSGAVFYMEQELFSEQADDLLASQKLDPNSARLLYRQRADKFLQGNGLARKGMVFKDVSFAQVKSMSYKDGKETTKQVAAAAHYGLELAGIPAWGPGAKVTVYFDAKGISGYYNALRQMEQGKSARILSPEAALDAYMAEEQPRSLLRLHVGNVEHVEIEKMKLVYYLDAGNQHQDQVTPHYLISGSFLGADLGQAKGDSTRAEFQWLEPAIR